MENIKNLYQHGGNIYEIEAEKRSSILDFSANINPLGIPARVKKLLTSQLKDIIHYPDSQARCLVSALARYWKIKEENILIGNGSTELIYLILSVLVPDNITLPVPSFTEYERAARISNSRLKFIYLLEDEDFRFNPHCLKKSDAIFICNPNNPTGNLMISNRTDIEDIPVNKIIIDEAFMDFVPEESMHTFIHQATKSRKLIVIRTLTKLFALPGLRIGYLVAHRNIIRTLKKYQIPWSVNVLAQIAATQCLSELAFMKCSRQFIKKERSFLYERIGQIKGLKPYLSVANFLLGKIENKYISSSGLKERLLKKGILIRDCANFRGLNKQFIRVAIRTHKENMRLVQELEECVWKPLG